MIRVDAAKIREVERKLGSFSKEAPNVINNALNRAITTVKSNISKKVRQKYHIKSIDVKKTLSIKKSTRQTLGAVVKSLGSAIQLYKFKVSPNKPRHRKPPKSIKVQVQKTGAKKIEGAFVAEVNENNRVFQRKSNAKHKQRSDKQWTALPIKQLFGPSIPQMLGNEGVKEDIENAGTETFNKRLDHEIKRILERNT